MYVTYTPWNNNKKQFNTQQIHIKLLFIITYHYFMKFYKNNNIEYDNYVVYLEEKQFEWKGFLSV